MFIDSVHVIFCIYSGTYYVVCFIIRGQQAFFVNGQIVIILGFMGLTWCLSHILV